MFEDSNTGDKWIWLPGEALTEPNTNNNGWSQEPPLGGSTEGIGGRGIPVSPYGQALYKEAMERFQPLSPQNLTYSSPINQGLNNSREQFCQCNCHGGHRANPHSNLNTHTAKMHTDIQTNHSEGAGFIPTALQPIQHTPTSLNQSVKTNSIEQMFETIQNNQMVLLTNIGSFQRATEERLDRLENKAGDSNEHVKTLSGNIDKAQESITELDNKSKASFLRVNSLENTLKAAMAKIDKLENDVLDLDRHNRAYCLRILNVPEENREICRETVANIIRTNRLLHNCENLTVSTIANQIENAHRLGKLEGGRIRHLLVRFHEVPFRDTVIRSAKRLPGGKTQEGYIFLDDLNLKDREIKNRNSDITESHYARNRTAVLYKGGQFKVNGRWYGEEEYRRTRPRQ